MQHNEGGYNRRNYLDDQGGPSAGCLEPLVESACAHTKEHAQTLVCLFQTAQLDLSQLHTHVCIQ